MNTIKHLLKGIAVGVATLVPGVSGGTMAMILGIYDELISAVGSFFKDIKSNFIFLFKIGLGGVIGMFLFSNIIDYSLTQYEVITKMFFLGIVIGGLPFLFKEANDTTDKKKTDYLFLIIGFILIYLTIGRSVEMVNLVTNKGFLNFIVLIIAGVIISVALILPGISTSFLLLALGLYELTTKAIKDVDLSYLIPIGIGAVIGALTTAKILENLMKKYPRQTYFLIIGFVIGSLKVVFPSMTFGIEIIYSAISFLIGFIIIMFISNRFAY